MIAASYGTFSDVEIMWSAIALFGLVYAAVDLVEATKDYRYARSLPHRNGRYLVARFAFRMGAMRTVCQLLFLAVGIAAMLLPDTPTGGMPLKLVLASALARWALITGASLTALQSFLARNVRADLLSEGERQAPPRGDPG